MASASSRLRPTHRSTGRLLVWSALTIAFLGYLRWGRETTSVTNFYFIRRSVPEIWRYFYEGLPEIGNPRLLDALYWSCISALIVGIPLLVWFALAPEEPVEPAVIVEPAVPSVPVEAAPTDESEPEALPA